MFEYSGYNLFARLMWPMPEFCHRLMTGIFGVVVAQERDVETHEVRGYRFIAKPVFDEMEAI